MYEVIINGLLKTGNEIEDLIDYLYKKKEMIILKFRKKKILKKKKEEVEEENNENINYNNYYE